MSADFVIVGAGSAGCVLADRLSADGRNRVTLIEAGPSDRRLWVSVPLGYGKSFYDASINWMYKAEPDSGLGGRSDFWPRGKVVGGSSSINAMVWIRGAAADYDEWADAGNVGWGYADVLPYFKAIEHNEGGADEWRGSGGPVHISNVAARMHPLAHVFLRAGQEAGLPLNPDFNGAAQEGVGIYQINTHHGWRMSAAKAFLRPALKRPNVRLITNAQATRIVFDGRRATGVEIQRSGRRETITAHIEVIIAAGAVNSPQILQLSGIGPGSHLAAYGLPVLLDNPHVGANLQDHLGINYVYRARVPTLNQILRPWWGKALAGLQFFLASRGPLSLSLNQGGGFIRTRDGLDRPNIQLYLQAISTMTARTGTRPLLTPDPFAGFALGLSNCRPKSRGRIAIRSADPLLPAAIEPNSFSAPEDLVDMLEGAKYLRHLAAMPSLAAVIERELQPGPDIVTDADIVADLRARAGTVYHPVGTCRMGSDPAGSVVDARLKVRGIDRLRVVDASIFPAVVSGNTNAPVMMVAAKAADTILSDYR